MTLVGQAGAAVIPVWDYQSVCDELGRKMATDEVRDGSMHYFRERSELDLDGLLQRVLEHPELDAKEVGFGNFDPEIEEESSFRRVRLTGLLFAPPETSLTKNDILPSIEYFHHRSGKNVDVFCVGYRRFGPDRKHDERQVSPDSPPWFFSVGAFDRLLCTPIRRGILGSVSLLPNGGSSDGNASPEGGWSSGLHPAV